MLWLAVGNIVREQASKLRADPTPQFLAGLAEVIWTQIGQYQPPATGNASFH